MELTSKQKAHLRGLAHPLNPVVFLGKEGASEAVVRKVHLELLAHELIKVRVGDGAEAGGAELADALVAGCEATLVQRVGHVIVLYRKRKKKPEIVLP
jgi:RNA-binding protein